MFGRSYWKLHEAIDKPYIFLRQKHRVLFHDALSVLAIAEHYYPHDKKAQQAALFHIQLDTMCSSNPLYRQQLEFLAEQDSKKRKHVKKRRNKRRQEPVVPVEFREFIEFCRKMQEINELSRIMRS